MSVLKTHHTNHTLVITISRPDSMNALNAEVLDGLGKIIQEAYQNNTVKGIIVTGEGDKAFVAGADIKNFLHSIKNKPLIWHKKAKNYFLHWRIVQSLLLRPSMVLH